MPFTFNLRLHMKGLMWLDLTLLIAVRMYYCKRIHENKWVVIGNVNSMTVDFVEYIFFTFVWL